jgi:hypothetical protein
MKKIYSILYVIVLGLFSSFKPSTACEYAGSNINFVKSQTQRALAEEDINQARYYTYKAVNAIEKSKSQLAECGCQDATLNIVDGLEDLKKATRTSTINATRLLLNRALQNILGGLEAMENHGMHGTKYSDNVLVMNTVATTNAKLAMKIPDNAILHKKIDESLENYKASLNTILLNVNCKDAKAFAKRVFTNCEAELLKPNLTEGKKYYNLRTKEITAAALEKLGDCDN